MGLQHTSAPPTATRLPFSFLQKITDNFSEERIIGSGGSAVVYQGVLDNGQEVAVKKIDGFGEAEFKNELRIHLRGFPHRNIVQLVAYCYDIKKELVEHEGGLVLADKEERALCFEYMDGGSLDGHISDELCGLGWDARFSIIKGTCEGVKYLHTGSKYSVYHLDLKPANILLDKNMRPKIGDFGISKLLGSMQTCVTETEAGTRGYMPPEHIDSREISHKFDIFSLGCLMKDLIVGLEAFKECADILSQEFIEWQDQKNLIVGLEGDKEYADMLSQQFIERQVQRKEKFIERVHEIWKSMLGAEMSCHISWQVKICANILFRCMEPDPMNRPTITEIVDELNITDAGNTMDRPTIFRYYLHVIWIFGNMRLEKARLDWAYAIIDQSIVKLPDGKTHTVFLSS